MKIWNREIGPGQPPFIVAEIGANHAGSLQRCLDTITAAKNAGADGVKLQAYMADTITIDSDRPEFTIKDGPWKGRRLYELYAKCETPFEWFPRIAEYAKNIGITWLASVFDTSSVDMLEKLGCPAYKIASFEIIDLPLIRYAARTGKPIILSTGMANYNEIFTASSAAYQGHGKLRYPDPSNAILLHCVSSYPAKPSDYNLREMPKHNSLYGVSDHTIGLEVPIAATALQCCMIEKHMTLDYSVRTEDDSFSLTLHQFSEMVRAVRNTWDAMQSGKSANEEPQRQLRRSLFAVKEIKKGEPFTHDNVRSIRPGDGLPPKEIDAIVGKTAARDIQRGEPMRKDMIQ